MTLRDALGDDPGALLAQAKALLAPPMTGELVDRVHQRAIEALLLITRAQAIAAEQALHPPIPIRVPEPELYFDEQTLFKVYRALISGTGMVEAEAMAAITAMQNEGILFREIRR